MELVARRVLMFPGAVHIKGHAGYLANQIYQQVYDFSVAELSGILFRCVECKVKPRDELDEQTARAIINQRVLGNPVIYEMGSRLLILKAYEIERINRGGSLFPISREIINRFSEGSGHFKGILDFLGTLSREHSTYLLNRAAAEIQWDHDFTRLVLGRCVWDWMYQPGKRELPDEYK